MKEGRRRAVWEQRERKKAGLESGRRGEEEKERIREGETEFKVFKVWSSYAVIYLSSPSPFKISEEDSGSFAGKRTELKIKRRRASRPEQSLEREGHKRGLLYKESWSKYNSPISFGRSIKRLPSRRRVRRDFIFLISAGIVVILFLLKSIVSSWGSVVKTIGNVDNWLCERFKLYFLKNIYIYIYINVHIYIKQNNQNKSYYLRWVREDTEEGREEIKLNPSNKVVSSLNVLIEEGTDLILLYVKSKVFALGIVLRTSGNSDKFFSVHFTIGVSKTCSSSITDIFCP